MTPVPWRTRCRRTARVAVGGRLAYTGDTGPTDALDDLARDADLLLAEASFRSTTTPDLHLTPAPTAGWRKQADVNRLVLATCRRGTIRRGARRGSRRLRAGRPSWLVGAVYEI